MNCTQVYNAVETTLIIMACLAAVGITAAWVIICLVNVIKWAVPEVLPMEPEPDYESDPDHSPTPKTSVQIHYLQAQKRLGKGWYLRGGEEVSDGDQ